MSGATNIYTLAWMDRAKQLARLVNENNVSLIDDHHSPALIEAV